MWSRNPEDWLPARVRLKMHFSAEGQQRNVPFSKPEALLAHAVRSTLSSGEACLAWACLAGRGDNLGVGRAHKRNMSCFIVS
jgi:hypothetical protein